MIRAFGSSDELDRERLLAAPVARLEPPDDALLAAVLLKLAGDRQLLLGDDVVAWLVSRVERSFAAAGAVVAALDRAGLAAKRRVTIPLAREALQRAVGGGESR